MENTVRRDSSNPNDYIVRKDFFKTHANIGQGEEGEVYVCLNNDRPYALKRFYSSSILFQRKIDYRIKKTNALQKIPSHEGLINLLGPVRFEGKRKHLGYLMDYIMPEAPLTLAAFTKDFPFFEDRIALLIDICSAMDYSHTNHEYWGDMKANNFLHHHTSTSGHRFIKVDRDFHAVVDKETGDFLGFDFLCVITQLLLKKYPNSSFKRIKSLISNLELLRALDVHAFTLMALELITNNAVWSPIVDKSVIKYKLTELLSSNYITLEEYEQLKAILSDTINKPSPMLVLNRLNERKEEINSLKLVK